MRVFPVYSSQEVLQFIYDCTKKILDNKIEGVLIECGIACGSQIGAMQECLVDNEISRRILGYDSFIGIPFAGEHDTSQPAIGDVDQTKLGLLESSGVTAHSQECVRENFGKWNLPMGNVELIEGWFQDTVENYDGSPIALLRLDGDLYESTYVCMKHLFKYLSKGGILIIDDYQLDGCRKAIHEFIDPKHIIEHLGIAYYIKPVKSSWFSWK